VNDDILADLKKLNHGYDACLAGVGLVQRAIAEIERLRLPIVVTSNERGAAVVSRQTEDGQIVEVLWEARQPEQRGEATCIGCGGRGEVRCRVGDGYKVDPCPFCTAPQPEQRGEVVAWRITDGEGDFDYQTDEPDEKSKAWVARYGRKWEPLYTAPPAPAVPDGWKLVPVEPTAEMIVSMKDYLTACSGGTVIGVRAGYRAMLAAAPEVKP